MSVSDTEFSFLVLHGPNLANVGVRQPEIYGTDSLDRIPDMVATLLGSDSGRVRLTFFQSNSEGALIDRMEQARGEGVHGIAFNAGAYTHTSLAIADAIAWMDMPVVEVHLSNVFARQEPIRRTSYMGAHVIGMVCGFGVMSYALAVQALYQHMLAKKQGVLA